MSEPALIPVLSDEEVREIEAECAHLPDRKSAAIDAMMIVQRHRGWVSDESLGAIAHLLGMSVENLDSIATFYNLIFRKPVGRHVVMVCDSVSCYVMGADSLLKRIEAHLGIRLGQTTTDGRFTLLPIVCLGACDKAPTMMIGDELIENVDAENLEEIFKRFE
ncbi:MAG: NADH-quinone oxidoreductase subunit NuoE [Gammaproteobacteria bacterium]|nr:NADH-quinone oxidoreductase subunit NuoE [Gammaproteobacteria bacterium]MDE0273631.1 NADH-quinone oxidoreductase subunit NuoE [Gammaproteobacteria bacterium]